MQHVLAAIGTRCALASLAKSVLDVEKIWQQTPSQLVDIEALRSILSFAPLPSASALDKLDIDLLLRIYHGEWTKMHIQSFIHALISASLQMSMDQNQGNDLFCCPRTWGAITVVLILKSCHFRTLYRSRREASAPRSSMDCLVRLYTQAWCWTVDSTACTSFCPGTCL